jgi:hypothetical protein
MQHQGFHHWVFGSEMASLALLATRVLDASPAEEVIKLFCYELFNLENALFKLCMYFAHV